MRLKLILSFALIVLVSVASVVAVARQSTANAVHGFMFQGGMSAVESLAETLEDYYRTNGSWQGVGSLLELPGGRGQGHGMGGMAGMMNQRLRVADSLGNFVADSADPAPSGRLSDSEQESAIRLEVDGRTVGYLLPEGGMGFNRNDERALVNRLNQAALTAGLVAGGLSLLLALLLAYTLLRPVRDLTRAASRLGKGDLSQRVPVRGDDELAILGQTFNAMADSLQAAENSRRALTADIAHELRTPLAVQRANLEALQDGIYSFTPENLEPILAQNLLLSRLVDDLRTLALAESGQLQLERVPADLPGLVRRVVDRFNPQAGARQIELRLQVEPNCPSISLDPGRMEQILGNLLSNALRYTPDGGVIAVHLACSPHAARITVQDSGPGIPPEALPHVFERFYRADRARSRNEGGSGLGLAIARQLAEAHQGSLTAANHPQGGAVFTLSLPVPLSPVS